MRPYFYDNKPIDASNSDFASAYATAEMVLDTFDLVAGQSRDYSECWSATDAWDAWIIDMFSNSPILRETYDQRKDWYGPELVILRKQVHPKSTQ